MKRIHCAFVALALLGIAACSVNRQNNPFDRDLSNRCSVAGKVILASWDEGPCGFVAPDSLAVMRTVDHTEGWSTTLFEGAGALEIRYPEDAPAGKWQTVVKHFAEPLDLSATPLIEYGILAAEGPGRDFITRLALENADGERFEAMSHIIPTLWRSVIFDLHECPFLHSVAAIEIGVRNDSEEPWQNGYWLLDGLAVGTPLDLDFNVEDSEKQFVVEGEGSVSRYKDALKFDFHEGSALTFRCDSSRNMVYNPDLQRRNTIAITLENRSKANSLTLSFATETNPDFIPGKTLPMPAAKGMHILSFNLSDIPEAEGHLRGLRLQPVGGSGIINIDRISFEREEPIEENCGEIESCVADSDNICITGVVLEEYVHPGSVVEIRHAPLYKSELPIDSLELIASSASAIKFRIDSIPNSRLDGRMTHLSSRFLATLRQEDGRRIKLGQPFFIENWRDFAENPYEFENLDKVFSVLNYGAKGDGITNDNAAIQKAIDAAANAGGGKVVLPAGADAERQYIATDLRLKAGVTLDIEPGAVLRQSPFFNHYMSYRPEYGHDNIIPGVPWTHCMYTNMPLILAKDTDHVKITGGGTIRMDDTFSENPSWSHYARTCSDRIHIVPIAVCNTHHVEISDLDIKRCSNYHTIFYRADSVFIGNLKMLEVACLSGDGLSFGNAVTNVRVERCVFESNDDGIVLCSSYKDPRGGNWRERVDSIDSSVRHIEVYRSYIDCARGGGGKAIALIPWGSTNPRQDYNEIDDIEVRDCVLRGGNSVGCWADNPFDGKPFTNMEEDDYAPVKNLRIFNNEYLSPCYIFWVKPTTLLTDCGLNGSSEIKNPNFEDRLAYWTCDGEVDAYPGCARIDSGLLYQGLWLEPGKYAFKCSCRSNGSLMPFVSHPSGSQVYVDYDGNFSIEKADTYLVGASGHDVMIPHIEIYRTD